MAYTAAHFPLRAPEEDIAAYAGHDDDGYQVVCDRRIQQLKEIGLIAPNVSIYERPRKPDPDIAARLETLWKSYVRRNNVLMHTATP